MPEARIDIPAVEDAAARDVTGGGAAVKRRVPIDPASMTPSAVDDSFSAGRGAPPDRA